jgi:hypothetical protein
MTKKIRNQIADMLKRYGDHATSRPTRRLNGRPLYSADHWTDDLAQWIRGDG